MLSFSWARTRIWTAWLQNPNYLSLTKRASVTADQKKGLLFKSMHRSNPLAAAGENDPTGELSRT